MASINNNFFFIFFFYHFVCLLYPISKPRVRSAVRKLGGRIWEKLFENLVFFIDTLEMYVYTFFSQLLYQYEN